MQDDIKFFKRSIVAWTIRLVLLPLLVVVAAGRWEIAKGLAFGLCIGLINFELMTRFNAALLRSRGRSRAAVLGTFVRLGVIFAGGVAAWYRQWNLIAAAAGCFSFYPVLLAHGLLLGRRGATASTEAER